MAAALTKRGNKDIACSDELGPAVAQAQASVPSGKVSGSEAPGVEHGLAKRKTKAERRAEQRAAKVSMSVV